MLFCDISLVAHIGPVPYPRGDMRKTLLKAVILVVYLLLSIPSFAQEQIPTDPRYWRYHKWYKNHSILHLVVDGTDLQHLSKVLEDREELKKRGVYLGEVMIIGDPDPMRIVKERRKNYRNAQTIIERFNLGESSLENAKDVVEDFGISHSPTWIVRFRGKNYVFEGLRTPERLFTSEGVFRGAQ